MPASVVADWRALLERVADDAEWQAGVGALFAAPRIRAFRDPAQYLQQQSRFYERLVSQLGAKP